MLDKILNWFALILVLIGAIGTVGLITYLISLFITRKYEMLDKMLDWFFLILVLIVAIETMGLVVYFISLFIATIRMG
jgi:hypothetical protein